MQRVLTNILAIDSMFLNLNIRLFHKALNFLTFFLNLVSGSSSSSVGPGG
jgi:hypothetical protein